MTAKLKNFKDDGGFLSFFQSPYVIAAVLICSLGLSISAYWISDQYAVKRASDQFEYRAEKIKDDIAERMRLYEQVLWGGVGLFNAKDNVSRADWHNYVSTLEINKHWPGIQGVGYSILVKPEDKENHINAVRAESFAEYSIKPEGFRNEYSSIIYLEPFDQRNQRAFGYDMWSNPQRREAMQRAMDTGTAAVSGMITLVQETQEDRQRGFLMYVPVYHNKAKLETVADRRAAFAGWVYSPFRAGDLMSGIIGQKDPDIEFEIFDGDIINSKWLLYSSTGAYHYYPVNTKNRFSKTILLDVQGHLWTLYFSTSDSYFSGIDRGQQRLIVIGGVFVHVMLFYMIWSMVLLRKKAFEIAQDMTGNYNARTEELERVKGSLEEKVKQRTAELEKSRHDLEQRVQTRTQELEERMQELEIMNDAMIGRELKMQELSEENSQLKQKLTKMSGEDYSSGNI